MSGISVQMAIFDRELANQIEMKTVLDWPTGLKWGQSWTGQPDRYGDNHGLANWIDKVTMMSWPTR